MPRVNHFIFDLFIRECVQCQQYLFIREHFVDVVSGERRHQHLK
jgi:hypothetical protein